MLQESRIARFNSVTNHWLHECKTDRQTVSPDIGGSRQDKKWRQKKSRSSQKSLSAPVTAHLIAVGLCCAGRCPGTERPPAPPDAPGGNTPNWDRQPHGRPGTETQHLTVELQQIGSYYEICLNLLNEQTFEPLKTPKRVTQKPISRLF